MTTTTARMIPALLLLVAVLLSSGGAVVRAAAAGGGDTRGTQEYVPGAAPDGVVALTQRTFSDAIRDPAVPFWLLKFYAPWCGHCKALAPVLEKVAPQIRGSMAIGTVDCTVEKKLCDQYKVRGYPTLKFSFDGDVHDYPGGRAERDFVQFSEKMAQRSVTTVASIQELYQQMERGLSSDDGVAFVAYHPSIAVGEEGEGETKSIEDKLQATALTRVFAQVARKQKAYSAFVLLDGNDASDELVREGKPFVCRYEAGGGIVPPRCYDRADRPETSGMIEFVKSNAMATVSTLGANNFNKVGRAGKPLAIAVVDMQNPDQQESVRTAFTALRTFATAATNGDASTEEIRDKYNYGVMDGKLFHRFLSQFDVADTELPQLLVLDLPTKVYWQNATYKLNVLDFLRAVEDGAIPSRSAGPKGVQGMAVKFQELMVAYRPWSVVGLVLVLVLFLVLLLSIVSPADDLRPPYKPEDVPPPPAASSSQRLRATRVKPSKATTDGNDDALTTEPATQPGTSGTEGTTDEPKKDK